MTRRAAACALLLAASLVACKTVADEPAFAHDGTPHGAADEAPVVTAAEVGTIRNLHTFGDIWLAGQPSETDFALVQAAGVRTVANLRRADEPVGFDVAACVTGHDMAYVNPAFRGPAELTDEVFEALRDTLSNAERPLLLHCGSANRVGAVWIPWRVLDEGVPLEQAVAEAKEIGLRTPEYEAAARDYVARKQR